MGYDIINFCKFYSSALGQAAGHEIQACIHNIWPDLSGQSVLGIGYALPYLDFYLKPSEAVFALLPAHHGVTAWPDSGLSRLAIIEQDIFPLADESIDCLLMIHALEHTENARVLLREAWRVIKGNGRLLVIVPNRRSIWAHLEATPFGYGQPYTMTQLATLLHNNLFTPLSFQRTLYMLPSHSPFMMACKPFLDKGGPYVLQKFSGIVCIEAIKQVYAGKPVVTRSPVRSASFARA